MATSDISGSIGMRDMQVVELRIPIAQPASLEDYRKIERGIEL